MPCLTYLLEAKHVDAQREFIKLQLSVGVGVHLLEQLPRYNNQHPTVRLAERNLSTTSVVQTPQTSPKRNERVGAASFSQGDIHIYIYLYCMTSPRAEMRSDEPHVGRGQMRVEMQTPHNTELQVQLAYPHHRRADT